MSLPLGELTKDLHVWKMLKLDTDESPTDVHRTIWNAWKSVVRSHHAGHLPPEEYTYAYWMLVRAYNSIDKEYAGQESWNL